MPAKYGFGQSVRRIEDGRFLTGRGRYTADVVLPHEVHAVFLRAPLAHAEIAGVAGLDEARAMPGVLAVLTGEDLRKAGLGGLPADDKPKNRDGSTPWAPVRPLLAQGRVRFAGEPVACIVAETVEQAQDAMEAVLVDYESLPAVTGARAAAAEGAPLIWDDAPGNLALDYAAGDEAATEAAFAGAARVVRATLVQNRVNGVPMEPLAALAAWDEATGRYTLHCPSQGVHFVRRVLAEDVLKVPEWALHVLTPDVGGGFGVRVFPMAEQGVILWAARLVGRPVKWVAERMETMVADVHARDQVMDGALALDATGRFLALRVDAVAGIGAYLSPHGRTVPTSGTTASITGIYRTPVFFHRCRPVFTNDTPTDAYRGAGRPEAQYLVERLIDLAARELGLAPEEIRRRNQPGPDEMPFRTAVGELIDSGDFPGAIAEALRLAEADGFAARRAQSEAHGRLRGLGLASYMKLNGGSADELAEVRFDGGGGVTVLLGNQNNGQGHETMVAQLISERLGVPFESVRLVQGDSDQVAYGKGTGGSCALSVGGSAVVMAADKVIESGKAFAAELLEAAPADLEFADGRYTIAGTDRSVTMVEVARAAFRRGPRTAETGFGLGERHLYLPRGKTFPNGCHVCEVEVDPDTGRIEILAYSIVDDMGRIMNPMLVEGQVHGGVVQGIGQAMIEECVYDEEGQFLTASFMDYGLPRADEVPSFRLHFHEIPCTTNPLGVKGVGEAGTTGSMAAVVNAVVDALAARGVSHIDMPLTPEKVWRAANLMSGQESATSSPERG